MFKYILFFPLTAFPLPLRTPSMSCPLSHPSCLAPFPFPVGTQRHLHRHPHTVLSMASSELGPGPPLLSSVLSLHPRSSNSKERACENAGSDSVHLGWGLQSCIANKPLGDVHALSVDHTTRLSHLTTCQSLHCRLPTPTRPPKVSCFKNDLLRYHPPVFSHQPVPP